MNRPFEGKTLGAAVVKDSRLSRTPQRKPWSHQNELAPGRHVEIVMMQEDRMSDMSGEIVGADAYTICVESAGGKRRIVFKHAIRSIRLMGPMD